MTVKTPGIKMLQIAGHKTYVLGTIIVLEVQRDVRIAIAMN